MADDEKKTYRIIAGCWNCGDKRRQYEIPVGLSVGEMKCERCGVKGSLHRVEDEVLPTVSAGL